MKKVLALCGSLRARSSNLSIIEIVAATFADRMRVEVYDGLAALPHFNPDFDTDAPPAPVADFRRRLRAADGVLVSTPEYVFSIPAALKNALEWTVSSSDFAGRPTALVTASTDGAKTHESLFRVLRTIEAKIAPETALLVAGARAKVGPGGFADDGTRRAVEFLIEAFLRIMEE